MEFVNSQMLKQQQQQHFHVLVVDDNVIDRKLLERLLRDSSCKAATFLDSGVKALKYLGLLDDDIHNASSTSPESLQQNQQGSSWKDVPVVIMSSENIPSRISMCLEGGAEEFLLKPLQLSDLKKLQPHFLKPFDHFSEQDSADRSIASHNHTNNNDKNNSFNKTKAMSPEHGFKLQFASTIVTTILRFWNSL
ncbi:two-component response regulator ARR17-like isoform X7 [Abrus precatorius]|uniref:Two-component response regulator ARR17-like isoform X7 n=1 Tax=Abrus precatorius TaxID=3816 RepID=A0A8B8JHW9_ABRPR|nr:two-component response regulator ARR17-like isoform X7 [Abrus precatorius]